MTHPIGADLAYRRKLKRVVIASTSLLVLATVIWFISAATRSNESLLTESQQRLTQHRFADAEALAAQVLGRHPHDCRAAMMAARAAVAQHQDAKALHYLQSPADLSNPACLPCVRTAAEIAQRLGNAQAAERFLRRLVESDSSDMAASNQLAYLLGIEGRAFEASTLLFAALKSGRFTPDHLVMLAAGEPVVNDAEFVKRCRSAQPDDPLPLLGQAREALSGQDFETAEPLLRQIVAVESDSQEAQARWGSLLQQRGAAPDFLEWHAKLPHEIWHPEIWVVRGHWARAHAEPYVAARCFWEALRLDPNHRIACYQLGQLLREIGRPDDSQPCFKRAALLEQLAYLVDRIYENPQSIQLMAEAAQLNESLGRIWEAWGWAYGHSLSDPASTVAQATARRLQARLQPEMPRTMVDFQLGHVLNLTDQPLPSWEKSANQPRTNVAQGLPAFRHPPVVGVQVETESSVRFEDVAASVGLNFRYDNGHEPQAETTRMLESMGGGVAVLDFDLDGWPDIYFTQAGPWELGPSAIRPPDVLFRNRLGQSFADATEPSGLGDRSFSQGCTVGDFNNDGFPDLYVANIGRNRLYQNEGDGTFVDVTDAAGITAERWTNSCLLADINGDGWPDLYDVNYLSIAQAPRTLCIRGEEARTCGPGGFHAEPDQLYLNLGDGRFQDVTESSGIDVPNGKGLGIVAADFSGTGRLNLFVANDSVPNFYFVNHAEQAGAFPKFTEEALVSGLALSHDGLSAAWMGVAAGDANGDGRLDLFSTTYADQAKSLFVQEAAGGAFTDAIVSSGLNAPTWKTLGFGTQFLDGELDGWPDLVITNGHVFDLSHLHQAYQMPPQYFRNLGRGKFSEVPAAQLGDYFLAKYLGRGLARLDWNRDGLDDFAVSNMMAPAGLVTNRTTSHGHFFTLRIVGTKLSRDAIGTSVTLTSVNRTWTQQLTAGDGYQASNERKLHFGLGASSTIDAVTITWLGGESMTLTDLTCDAEWLLVEGEEFARRLSK
jgi:tetratricopeptide (TPR) repeat protein